MLNLIALTTAEITLLSTFCGIVLAAIIGIVVYVVVGRKRGKLQPAAKTNAREFSFKSVTYLTKISMFSALGVALSFLGFTVFPAVAHLKLDFSDVPTLLASFMFGPVTGIIVNAIKIAVGLLLRGTTTGFVGPLSNLVSGTLYAAVAGFIYLLRRNKAGAIIALSVSSAVFCVVMWFCNQWFLLPMYGIKDMAAKMPMLWWTLLFNVIKTVLVSVLTFFIYKPLSRALHWEIKGKKKVTESQADEQQATSAQDVTVATEVEQVASDDNSAN